MGSNRSHEGVVIIRHVNGVCIVASRQGKSLIAVSSASKRTGTLILLSSQDA